MDEPLNPTSDTPEIKVSSPEEDQVAYPPKYQKEENNANIWMKSIVSLAAYLILGYYVFPSYKILLLITLIVLIHEMGHFIAMKIFRYKDLGMFFIPLLGAYVSGTKREVSQRESAIILLSGPLPGMIIGILFFFLWQKNPYETFAGIPYERIAVLFVLLNLYNLLPIYPLDGGQLLNRLFLDEESWISKIFVYASAGLMIWVAWRMYSYTHHPLSFILLFFPLTLILRHFDDKRINAAEKRIEEAGINTDIEYDELPDKDYWAARNIVIDELPAFKDVPKSPPYEYSHKEEKIMAVIQSLLHRHLLQDVSVAGKIFILLIWLAAITSPWLLGMKSIFPGGFGF